MEGSARSAVPARGRSVAEAGQVASGGGEEPESQSQRKQRPYCKSLTPRRSAELTNDLNELPDFLSEEQLK